MNKSIVVLGVDHQRVSYFKTVKGSTPRRSLCGRHEMLSPCNDKLSPCRHFAIEQEEPTAWLFARDLTIDPFCLLRVKIVPSEENSTSCGALVDLFQPVIAIRCANYAFSSKLSLRRLLKTEVVVKMNSHVRLW